MNTEEDNFNFMRLLKLLSFSRSARFLEFELNTPSSMKFFPSCFLLKTREDRHPSGIGPFDVTCFTSQTSARCLIGQNIHSATTILRKLHHYRRKRTFQTKAHFSFAYSLLHTCFEQGKVNQHKHFWSHSTGCVPRCIRPSVHWSVPRSVTLLLFGLFL